jgi:hypothetical protein
MNDAAKLTSPKVSVRGQEARCVSCIGSVSGSAIATAATYAQAAKPYTAIASATALIVRFTWPILAHFAEV